MVNTIHQYVVSHKSIDDNRFSDREILFVNKGTEKTTSLNFINSWDGDNIDQLNPFYCELTALYWIYKNIHEKDSIISFEHYRRVFLSSKSGCSSYRFLDKNEIDLIFDKYSIIVPCPHHFVTDVYTHYKTFHNIQDIELMKTSLLKFSPDYKDSFESIFEGQDLSLFNMFIMKKELLEQYCAFAFPILDDVFSHIKADLDQRDKYQKRVMGFLSERLFNIWLRKNIPAEKIYQKSVAMLETKPFYYSVHNRYCKFMKKDYDLKETKLKN